MTKIQVIDNFLSDKEHLEYFFNFYIEKGNISLSFNNQAYAEGPVHSFSSSKDETKFDEIFIISKLNNKIISDFPNYRPTKWHLNVYPSGFDGHIHIDNLRENFNQDFVPTFLYCATPNWHPDWGGEFIIYDENNEAVDVASFREDRLIIFNSFMRHRAVGPTRLSNLLRTTIAFQVR